MEPSSPKVPPHSLEAEAAVLGGMLLDNTALDRVAEVITGDDFYREAHRKIFRAGTELSQRSEPIDLLTLSEALKIRGELAEVGRVRMHAVGAVHLHQRAHRRGRQLQRKLAAHFVPRMRGLAADDEMAAFGVMRDAVGRDLRELRPVVAVEHQQAEPRRHAEEFAQIPIRMLGAARSSCFV